MMMSRMLRSSTCILILFLCLSHECTGRHPSSDSLAMDDNAKLLSDSTIKSFENDLLTVPDHLNLKMTKKRKDHSCKVDNDHHMKTDSKSQNRKVVNKDQMLKKVQEEQVRPRHQHHPKSHTTVIFRIPPRNKRIHQQPGFNLDYSPPKTHPPSHN
ncbi:unnamed protein product [Lactuca saligna]|uniref:Uncharacterized protein n=1 Tax=Lactuca saligna TaxID=75948 RepID=A0AA35UZP5_LACSI|nr:unnamed protein product [Lactuca saligna]